MEPKTNYTVVGVTVLTLMLGLIIAGLWLSIGFERTQYHYYTVYMRESVSGLSDESLVKYNGVKVGIVDHIELSQFDPQQTKITIKVADGTPITMGTRATLITQGITGTTYLGLTANSPTFIPLQKTPGETYPVIPSKPSFFNQLEHSITDINAALKRVLNPENTENIKKTLDNLQKITDGIAKNDANIERSLEELPKVLTELRQGILKFNTMSSNLSTAGKQVTATMKAGRQGIDKISQQTLPPAILLLRRLDVIAANLEKVSAQMRENPGVMIRGSTPQKSGPGE